jgi:hypothetical protein
MGYIQDGTIYDSDGDVVATGTTDTGTTDTSSSATAGAVGGALGATVATPATNGSQTSSTATGLAADPWTWGTAAALVNPGTNPGYYAGTATPAYATNGVADVYNWGVQNQNGQVAGTQYGTPYSAVAGNEYLNIPQFINSTLPVMAHAAGTTAVSPYATNFNPPSSYYTTATQNVTSPIGQTYGGAGASPYTMSMPYLTPTTAVAPTGATNAGQSTASSAG